MTYYPDFYLTFSCRAGDCRHSCCRGWEIDVDEASRLRYEALPGVLGERLRAAMERDAEGTHFRLTAEERCPFLQPDGLCELICRLGADALCDICAAHPRFYVDLGADELAALGLSCEAACALLYEADAPLHLVSEDGARLTVPALLRRLEQPVPDRALIFDGAPPSAVYLARMRETEAIDDRWPEELARLCADLRGCPPLPTGVRYDRTLQYILLRQIDQIEDAGLPTLLRFARDSTAFVAAQDALYGPDMEHLRRWSEQIEYSTENVGILLGY